MNLPNGFHSWGAVLAMNWHRWWEEVSSNMFSMLVVALFSAALGWFIHGQQRQDDAIDKLSSRITAVEAQLRVLVLQHGGPYEPRQPPD